MGRAYLSERATGGAVEPLHIGRGWGKVDVSFVSFLCTKEKRYNITQSEQSENKKIISHRHHFDLPEDTYVRK
jgi:hypothetical protein